MEPVAFASTASSSWAIIASEITDKLREFSDEELNGITLAPSHAFVKARDREQDLVLRLKAVLAVRRPRRPLAVPA